MVYIFICPPSECRVLCERFWRPAEFQLLGLMSATSAIRDFPAFNSPRPYMVYPPPPVPKNRLAQETPPGSVVEFSHHFFFYHRVGFFMVLVDAG